LAGNPQRLRKSDLMLELNSENTLEYLKNRGDVPNLSSARVEMLGWGVSNVVLRVSREIGADFVIKQSRTQLRTKAAWFSRLDRIFREIGMLRLLEPLLPVGVIPKVLFEDRENYLFAMDAFPEQHIVWKQALLDGVLDYSIADRLGHYLSAIHSQTAFRPDLQQLWSDLEVFDQLRLDPFYRYLAAAKPVAAPFLERLISENQSTACCIVLADFSPKNILIAGDQIALVDFETGHYGDPAFDLGFFLSHLLLKAVRFKSRFENYAELTNRFWSTYWPGLKSLDQHSEFKPQELLRRTFNHLAGCMWARVDGKSPVDYLTDEAAQDCVRQYCLSLFEAPPVDWSEAISRLRRDASTSAAARPSEFIARFQLSLPPKIS
jgi:5-methylthioribose kinase